MHLLPQLCYIWFWMPGNCRFSKAHWAVKLALHGRKFDSRFRMHRGTGPKNASVP